MPRGRREPKPPRPVSIPTDRDDLLVFWRALVGDSRQSTSDRLRASELLAKYSIEKPSVKGAVVGSVAATQEVLRLAEALERKVTDQELAVLSGEILEPAPPNGDIPPDDRDLGDDGD